MRSSLVITAAFLLLIHIRTGLAQPEGNLLSASSSSSTAFVDVNVVPMDSESVLAGQTVVVQQGRITAIGPVSSTPIPSGTTVIEGHSRYLMPGLADMHVHLEGRENFGDAPLFLAYGITTVMNLRGRPEILAWKKEIATGKLLAPNLYTSGEFVNEPRVSTPKEVEDEVIRQKADGYDVIKFHEIVENGRYVTTIGLSRPAYDAMNSSAHRIGIPLIGHAPDNLGLQAVLDDHQNLAHSGILVALYFVPKPLIARLLLPSLFALGVVLLAALGMVVITAVFWFFRKPSPFGPQWRSAIVLAALSLVFVLLWPGWGLLSSSVPFLVLLSIVSLLILIFTLNASARAWRGWRDASMPLWAQLSVTVFAAASLAFTLSLAVWVPVAWRSSQPNLTTLAEKFHGARIWVEPTLDIYQNSNRMNEGRSAELLAHPVNRYVPPNIEAGWAGLATYHPPFKERVIGFLFRRTLLISEQLTGRLQDADVPLMLGTDTFGFPFCIAGKSAHDEMDLMQASGLTTFQVLQSATVNPAKFFGEDNEFGTVTVGKRADLLLVKDNPLTDLETTRRPDGVMLRGVWLPAENLQRMLENLSSQN
jgi:hypothetical protein